jgi:hypothetical protein
VIYFYENLANTEIKDRETSLYRGGFISRVILTLYVIVQSAVRVLFILMRALFSIGCGGGGAAGRRRGQR